MKNLQKYLVGGAVRDVLLGLDPKDKDYVVVNSSEQEMESLGFEKVGKDFPVFLHPKTGEEYALARKEIKTGSGYNGFDCVVENVTLEDDLFRRDLTINAMALDDKGNLIDPFNGKKDLQNKILKHVSHHFAEDPVRILRIARFSARYNFSIHPDTISMMKEMVNNGEFDSLTSERVWKEFEKVSNEPYINNFFMNLQEIGALEKLGNFKNIFNHSELFNNINGNVEKNKQIYNFCLMFEDFSINELKNFKIPNEVTKYITIYKNWINNENFYTNLSVKEKLTFIKETKAVHENDFAIENLNLILNKKERFLSKEHDYQESIFLNDVHKLKNIDYEELTKNVDKKEIGKIINLAQINALTDTCKKVMKP